MGHLKDPATVQTGMANMGTYGTQLALMLLVTPVLLLLWLNFFIYFYFMFFCLKSALGSIIDVNMESNDFV